eukprot:3386708-Pyramimonas_sp.AAC.1
MASSLMGGVFTSPNGYTHRLGIRLAGVKVGRLFLWELQSEALVIITDVSVRILCERSPVKSQQHNG